jgi:hypothetical protein
VSGVEGRPARRRRLPALTVSVSTLAAARSLARSEVCLRRVAPSAAILFVMTHLHSVRLLRPADVAILAEPPR